MKLKNAYKHTFILIAKVKTNILVMNINYNYLSIFFIITDIFLKINIFIEIC